MMQEIEYVKVLTKGAGAELSGGTIVSELKLKLNRMGVRVDVLLKAADDFESEFKGVTFSNIPDKVALTDNYTGTIERSVTRQLLRTSDASYFQIRRLPVLHGLRKFPVSFYLPMSQLRQPMSRRLLFSH